MATPPLEQDLEEVPVVAVAVPQELIVQTEATLVVESHRIDDEISGLSGLSATEPAESFTDNSEISRVEAIKSSEIMLHFELEPMEIKEESEALEPSPKDADLHHVEGLERDSSADQGSQENEVGQEVNQEDCSDERQKGFKEGSSCLLEEELDDVKAEEDAESVQGELREASKESLGEQSVEDVYSAENVRQTEPAGELPRASPGASLDPQDEMKGTSEFLQPDQDPFPPSHPRDYVGPVHVEQFLLSLSLGSRPYTAKSGLGSPRSSFDPHQTTHFGEHPERFEQAGLQNPGCRGMQEVPLGQASQNPFPAASPNRVLGPSGFPPYVTEEFLPRDGAAGFSRYSPEVQFAREFPQYPEAAQATRNFADRPATAQAAQGFPSRQPLDPSTMAWGRGAALYEQPGVHVSHTWLEGSGSLDTGTYRLQDYPDAVDLSPEQAFPEAFPPAGAPRHGARPQTVPPLRFPGPPHIHPFHGAAHPQGHHPGYPVQGSCPVCGGSPRVQSPPGSPGQLPWGQENAAVYGGRPLGQSEGDFQPPQYGHSRRPAPLQAGGQNQREPEPEVRSSRELADQKAPEGPSWSPPQTAAGAGGTWEQLELAGLQKEVGGLKMQLKETQLTLLEHQHELSESDRRTAELQLQVRQAEAKAATAEREAAEAKLREAEKREALMRTEASLKGLTAQCEVLRRGRELGLEEANSRIEEIERERMRVADLRDEVATWRDRCMQAEHELASEHKRLENLANRERQIDLTLQRLRKEHASAAVRAERAEDEVARLRDALQTAAGEAKAADRRLAALDADNGSLRREAAGLKQHLRGMEAEAAKLREGLHAAKDEVGDLKNRYRQLERAALRFEISPDPAGMRRSPPAGYYGSPEQPHYLLSPTAAHRMEPAFNLLSGAPTAGVAPPYLRSSYGGPPQEQYHAHPHSPPQPPWAQHGVRESTEMERVSSPPEGPSRQPVFERASAPWAQPRERSFPDPSSEEHGMAQHGASELHSRLQQLFAAEGVSVGAGGRPGYPGGAPRFEPPQHDVYSFEGPQFRQAGPPPPAQGEHPSHPRGAPPLEDRHNTRVYSRVSPQAGSPMESPRGPARAPTADERSRAQPGLEPPEARAPAGIPSKGAGGQALAQWTEEDLADRRPERRPYATEQSLQLIIEQTKGLEDQLMALNQERSQLEAEYARMPANAGRTLRERRRKAEVEERMDELGHLISNVRLNLKKMGVK